ncbi:polysaccharide pyruvyl transferase family protein [Caulobacter endophyticus]|uniref:polysaccharide pyruvyl transferase family protein n=1 Tax=Caulobacter endophyticus TaxID=2172652 RepID=UPI00240FDDC1|nr:polysaccharide pyruvyl transferase family protein [Caulobacter endophyticus]MDG2528267.1 polysaccharide pyruvyl transferase family protein [Caulobacter endophyticus]
MQVLHFHAEHGNFGDDLNESLWRRVLDPRVWDAPDTVLVGIGTILNADRLSRESLGDARVFILGSGAGYGRLAAPEIIESAKILAVRGPLTAALVSQPDRAATDGAALLATLPECQPIERGARAAYIPHISSALTGDWAKVCQLADLDYIDPRWSVERVISAIQRADVVITEAMHGAILSDTLRVPWVPVVTSQKILDLKWHDWTRSLDLVYAPHFVAPARAKQALVQMRARAKANPPSGVPSNEALLADFRARYGGQAHRSVSKPKVRAERPVVDKLLSAFDPLAAASTARALHRLKSAPRQLSADTAFRARLNQLQDAVGSLERAVISD